MHTHLFAFILIFQTVILFWTFIILHVLHAVSSSKYMYF